MIRRGPFPKRWRYVVALVFGRNPFRAMQPSQNNKET